MLEKIIPENATCTFSSGVEIELRAWTMADRMWFNRNKIDKATSEEETFDNSLKFAYQLLVDKSICKPEKIEKYDSETGEKIETFIGGWRKLGTFLQTEQDYTLLSKALTQAIANGNPVVKKEVEESAPGEGKK